MTYVSAARDLIREQPALAREIARQMARPQIALTRQQRRCLDFIREYIAKNGMAPAYDEMQTGLRLSSRSSVSRLVDALEERGHIYRLPGKARSIALVEVVA